MHFCPCWHSARSSKSNCQFCNCLIGQVGVCYLSRQNIAEVCVMRPDKPQMELYG